MRDVCARPAGRERGCQGESACVTCDLGLLGGARNAGKSECACATCVCASRSDVCVCVPCALGLRGAGRLWERTTAPGRGLGNT